MIFEYIIKLLIFIPLIGGLVWGSLLVWRRLQLNMPLKATPTRPVKVVDVISMGTTGKLAVVEFAGQQILLGISRAGISPITAARAEGTTNA